MRNVLFFAGVTALFPATRPGVAEVQAFKVTTGQTVDLEVGGSTPPKVLFLERAGQAQ